VQRHYRTRAANWAESGGRSTWSLDAMRSVLWALLWLWVLPSAANAGSLGRGITTGACFFRLEELGILNIRPSSIRVDGLVVGEIVGGQFKCISLSSGRHVAQASSRDPYDPYSNNLSAWQSPALTFDIKKGSRAYLEIWPKDSDWRLSRRRVSPNEDEFYLGSAASNSRWGNSEGYRQASEIVPVGPDTYKITVTGPQANGKGESVAKKRAAQYCAVMRQSVVVKFEAFDMGAG